MPAKPIPDGYHTATPYLVVQGAKEAIKFYQEAFGARELLRLDYGDKIAHAEVQIGDSPIMLSDEMPEMGYRGPKAIGGTPVSIMLYVTDVDRVYAQAVAAGAEAVRPVQDEFYGDRCGKLIDPFGHVWMVATHKEDLSPEEIDRRFKAMSAAQPA